MNQEDLKREIARLKKTREAKSRKMGVMTPPPIRAEVLGKIDRKIQALESQLGVAR